MRLYEGKVMKMKLIPLHKVHGRLPSPEPNEKSDLRGMGLYMLTTVLQRAASPWASSAL